MTDALTALTRSPLLGVIPTAELQRLAGECAVCHFPEGFDLVREGDEADAILLILSGEACLLPAAAGFASAILRLGPNELVGACELLTGAPHACGIRAVQTVTALRLDGPLFKAWLEAHFETAIEMISALASHLRNQVREITELKMQSTAERLASYLLQLAGDATGRTVVRLPCEKRQLADSLGMDPATLSRAFAKLREKGVTANRTDKVVISDVGTLRRFGECAALSA